VEPDPGCAQAGTIAAIRASPQAAHIAFIEVFFIAFIV
jgi:hypothetical protein